MKKNRFLKNSPHSPLTSEQREGFTELDYFPINEEYKFEVELKEFSEQSIIKMVTSKGTEQEYIRFGYIEFEVKNEKCMLTVFKQHHSDYLFVPFKDKTSGVESYGAGRYMEIERIKHSLFILDFNISYNPFCAYNDQWVCPMTPFENNLKVEILAGEKKFSLKI